MKLETRRLLASLLIAMIAAAGCSKAAQAPASGAPSSPVQSEAPVLRKEYQPTVVLTVPLGDKPEQPGRTPARVGGVSAAGPRSLAVGPTGEIYLLDNAHARLLRYDDAKFHSYMPLPWLDDQAGSLIVWNNYLFLYSAGQRMALDLAGNLQSMTAKQGALFPYERISLLDGKAPDQVGKDGAGRTYWRVIGTTGGVTLERRDARGQTMASAPEPGVNVVDWYVSQTGGLYTLSWVYSGQAIEAAQIHEVLPPDGKSPMPKDLPDLPQAAPLAFERPVPASLQFRVPGWTPTTLKDPVDIHNVWMLLAGAQLQSDAPPPETEPPIVLTATFGGQPMEIKLYAYYAVVKDRFYVLSDAAWRTLHALALTPASLKQALENGNAAVVMYDVPGVGRTLTDQEKQRVLGALEGAVPMSYYATPQPLEAPFPRYALRTSNKDDLELRGSNYLSLGHAQAIALQQPLDTLFKEWVPTPDLAPGNVAYLFLADALDLNGQDLTRWKNTVVRYLLGQIPVDPRSSRPYAGPFTLTFIVKGKQQMVQVDEQGFTYAGRRYSQAGLSNIMGLMGVP